jgi:hypothetical protein
VLSAVVASCDDEYEDNRESCDHGKSFHYAVPTSKTRSREAILARVDVP